MYYALTEKGLNKVEAGLPDKPSDYYSVLGAIADLEEKYGGSKAICQRELVALVEPKNVPLPIVLGQLIRNGLVEVVKEGDKRFTWTKEPTKKVFTKSRGLGGKG